MNLLWLFKSKSTTMKNKHDKKGNEDEDSIYALDHALLNIPLPPPTMWMNMGYWKNATDFPTACAALLDQVLATAGLVGEDGSPVPHDNGKRLRLLDVGIGCGDQSLRCLGYRRGIPGSTSGSGNADVSAAVKYEDEKKTVEDKPLFDSYTGITSIPVQAKYAAQRLNQESKSSGSSRGEIFCADAANPASWSEELTASIDSPSPSPSPSPSTSQSAPGESEDPKKEGNDENWLLALDTLYHFTPSRKPLFSYTRHTLCGSLMAFDLVLSPTATFLQKLLLRILCLFAGTPFTNFITETEYISLLVSAGYEEEKIVVKDISGHVFSGISGYIRDRDEVLKTYRMSKGMGKFRGAGKLFGWWARSGVVRGVVVVARV
ncbi:hypothetical protein BDV18DRAFT_133969 [Aspergillus unguis]